MHVSASEAASSTTHPCKAGRRPPTVGSLRAPCHSCLQIDVQGAERLMIYGAQVKARHSFREGGFASERLPHTATALTSRTGDYPAQPAAHRVRAPRGWNVTADMMESMKIPQQVPPAPPSRAASVPCVGRAVAARPPRDALAMRGWRSNAPASTPARRVRRQRSRSEREYWPLGGSHRAGVVGAVGSHGRPARSSLMCTLHTYTHPRGLAAP